MYIYKIEDYNSYANTETMLMHTQKFTNEEFKNQLKEVIEVLKEEYFNNRGYELENYESISFWEIENKMQEMFEYEGLDILETLSYVKIFKEGE